MRSIARGFLLFTAVVSVAAVQVPLHAQDVTVQSVVDTRFYGAVGRMVDIAARVGGANLHDVPTTTYIAGHRMRVEDKNSVSIIDVDAGRMTEVDLKEKTFTTITFEEMAAAIAQAQQQAQQQAAGRDAQTKDAAKPAPSKDEMQLSYDVKVDRPGEHERIAGADAERVFITITVTGAVTPEGEKTEQVGSLVMLLDQWMSASAPQIAATQAFYQAYAKRTGQAFRKEGVSLEAAFSADPRLKGGMEAAARELQKLSGVALRSTTYAVLLPATAAFDRSLTLGATSVAAEAPAEKKQGGLRGMMGAVKKAATEASTRGAASDGKSPATQSTLLAIHSEVQSISTAAVPASMFAAPAGFREITRRDP